MSRTTKEGKRGSRKPKQKPRPGTAGAVAQRHTYGSTEKILRRNRKIWTRLTAKIGRRNDKKETERVD